MSAFFDGNRILKLTLCLVFVLVTLQAKDVTPEMRFDSHN